MDGFETGDGRTVGLYSIECSMCVAAFVVLELDVASKRETGCFALLVALVALSVAQVGHIDTGNVTVH